MIGLAAYVIRIPVQLERFDGAGAGVVLPRGDRFVEDVLPAPLDQCRLTDLAPVLAEDWGLDDWRTPAELRFVDGDGFIVSQWGDLSPASAATRLVRQWAMEEPAGGSARAAGGNRAVEPAPGLAIGPDVRGPAGTLDLVRRDDAVG